MNGARRGGRCTGRRCAVALLVAVVLLPGPGSRAGAQDVAWTARVSLQALSVRDAGDWLALRQEVGRRYGNGRRLRLGLVETRRFGAWDAGLEAGGTVRAGELYLSLDGGLTPEADVVEDARVGARVALPVGEVVPSVGYRVRLYADGPVHTVSPRLEWYRGPWLLSGELRVTRSAAGTTNPAGIVRVTRRLSSDGRVWLGAAGGEEDFLVGRPPDQRLRTLDTRSLVGGVEWALPADWTVRLDVTGVDSDPRLDRAGGTLTVTRAF